MIKINKESIVDELSLVDMLAITTLGMNASKANYLAPEIFSTLNKYFSYFEESVSNTDGLIFYIYDKISYPAKHYIEKKLKDQQIVWSSSKDIMGHADAYRRYESKRYFDPLYNIDIRMGQKHFLMSSRFSNTVLVLSSNDKDFKTEYR